MTNEERTELIRHLKYSRSIGADYLITDNDVDKIIKALEQEPFEGYIGTINPEVMFLELHSFDKNEKRLLNIDRINSVYQEGGAVYIYIGEVVYRVKESYEDIVNQINKYYNQ